MKHTKDNTQKHKITDETIREENIKESEDNADVFFFDSKEKIEEETHNIDEKPSDENLEKQTSSDDKDLDENDKTSEQETLSEDTEENPSLTEGGVDVVYHLQDKPSTSFIHEHKLKLIVGLVVVLLLSSLQFYKSQLKPVQSNLENYLLEVQEGDYFSHVLNKLSEDKVIKNKTAAKIYAKLNGLESVAAGNYELDKVWSTPEIIEYLNTTIPHDDILVKFHEGSWAKDIAKVIAENFGFKEEEIIALWNDKDYIKTLQKEYKFLPNEIFENEKDKKVLLEGFLYPDTYSFNRLSTLEEITQVILDNTEEKLELISVDLEKSDMSFYDIMTLSSIVMYEAGEEADQRIVAGVFKNRLDIDMALGSSVTVCYTIYEFDDWEECEHYANLQIDSPYNTYMYAGLPIGPILNPNIDAIKNTINYQKNDYFYFVADAWNGDGTIYYSKTLSEHEKKVAELSGR